MKHFLPIVFCVLALFRAAPAYAIGVPTAAGWTTIAVNVLTAAETVKTAKAKAKVIWRKVHHKKAGTP